MMGFDASAPANAQQAVVNMAELSAVFAVKHYVADFLLQTNWMARCKERQRQWVSALTIHALCHATLTGIVIAVVAPHLWWLAALDFVVHFAIDRSKAMIAVTNRWQPTQPQFWWLLGFDQMLHQLTNVCIAMAIVLM